MLTLIYKLTQADSEIVNNLNNQDQQLENLNAQLDVVKSDYVKMLNTTDTSSFFNLNNIYFWFLIAGLLLLLFGLLYLWVELRQHRSGDKEKSQVKIKKEEKPVEKAKPEPKKIEEPVFSTQDLIKLAKVSEDIEEPKKITKARKIKVSKVK